MFPSFMLLILGVALAGILLKLLIKHTRGSSGSYFDFSEPHKPSVRYQHYDDALERIREKDEVDRILEKISKKGIERLSMSEREKLEIYSQKK